MENSWEVDGGNLVSGPPDLKVMLFVDVMPGFTSLQLHFPRSPIGIPAVSLGSCGWIVRNALQLP